MTENTSVPGEPAAEDGTVEPAEIATAAPEAAPEGGDTSEQDQRLSDEAAKWRVQARAEETNRLLAEARVAGLQTREVNRLLRAKLAAPADFWLVADVKLEDLLTYSEADADMVVDADKVHAAADAITESRPHWRAKLGPVGAPSNAVTGDGKYNVAAAEKPSWDTLLKGGKAG